MRSKQQFALVASQDPASGEAVRPAVTRDGMRRGADLLAARPFRLTTFPNDEGYDELVLARVPAAPEPM